jgi:hypothetical protein
MHHIFNTNFEWELEKERNVDLERSFSKIQKKFLHLASFFKQPGDTVFPEKPMPGQIINSWAPSKLILAYAKKHELSYKIPSWELVQKLQSKAFAHTLSPLPNSALIYSEKELDAWLEKNRPPFVFKSFYGFSGTGHKFRAEKLTFPVLAEPWVERSFDFSTQWFVDESGAMTYLGATKLISDERGKYKKTEVSVDEKALFGAYYPFLEEQIAFIKKQEPHFSSFFGHIGFDAFVYNNRLQPICEINARKTFGFFALYLLKQNPEKHSLSILFDKTEITLLVN